LPVESGMKGAIVKLWRVVSHVVVILIGALVGDFVYIFRIAVDREYFSPSGKWLSIEVGAILLWLLWNAYSVLLARLTERDWRRIRSVDVFTLLPLLLLALHSHNHLIRELFSGVYYATAYIVAICFLVLALKVIHAAALIGGWKWALSVLVSVPAGMAVTKFRYDLAKNIFTWMRIDVFISIQLISAMILSLIVLISGMTARRPGRAIKGLIPSLAFFIIWWFFSSAPKMAIMPGPGIADQMPPALPMGLFEKGGPVKRVRLAVADELRDAILFTRPGEVSQKIDIAPGTKLAFGIGIAAFEDQPNEAVLKFKLDVEINGVKKDIWTRDLNPLRNLDDREWIDSIVDLSPYSGSDRVLTFYVAGGPFGAISRPIPVDSNEKPGLPPNILLVLVDTVRADHVGAYGYRRDTTPFIDEIVKSGMMFRKTVSTSAWTEPATFTLLTGMIPAQAEADMFASVVIPDEVEFISEILERRGYHTVAISGNYYITVSNNFAQGFETYNEQCLPYFHWRSAECVTDEALKWAGSNTGKPYFMYLHYVDPHSRYNAPPPFHDKFSLGYVGEDPRIKNGETNEFELLYERSGKKIALSDEDRRYLIDLYDGEIAYADSQIRRLFAELKKLGLLENVIVVITSDHGEEFTEHGMLGHRLNLHSTLLNVPLVFWGDGIPSGMAVDEQVSLADVMPTILDLIGVKPSSFCWGRSLVPLWKGQNLPPRVCFSQRKQLFLKEWAVTDDKYKLIAQGNGAQNRRWYDIISDPLEYNSISPDPVEKRKLQSQLDEILGWIGAHKIRWTGARHRISEEEQRKRIKVMGY